MCERLSVKDRSEIKKTRGEKRSEAGKLFDSLSKESALQGNCDTSFPTTLSLTLLTLSQNTLQDLIDNAFRARSFDKATNLTNTIVVNASDDTTVLPSPLSGAETELERKFPLHVVCAWLGKIIEAWPTLSEATRKGIVSLAVGKAFECPKDASGQST